MRAVCFAAAASALVIVACSTTPLVSLGSPDAGALDSDSGRLVRTIGATRASMMLAMRMPWPMQGRMRLAILQATREIERSR